MSSTAPAAPWSAGAPADVGPALRAVFRALPRLEQSDPAVAEEARDLLARPTAGGEDPRGDGYTVSSTRRCRGPVCVHWVRSTSDAPRHDAWAETTLRVVRRVWRLQVEQLGYRAPLKDGERGGDGRLDVYLADIGARGLFGYCVPEQTGPASGHAAGTAASYCVLDDDFARDQFAQRPVRSLRVTAAHELFHAVQFAYDYREDPWLQESTATWMEERFADHADDNRRYLPYGQLRIPGIPLDRYQAGGFAQYGAWVFWENLSERFGDDVVRQVWATARARPGVRGGASSLEALSATLREHGGLSSVFARYAADNLARASRYDEGRSWPRPEVQVTRELGRRLHRVTELEVRPLAAGTLALRPARALRGSGHTLRVVVRTATSEPGAAASAVVRTTHGAAVEHLPLDAAGRGVLRVPLAADVRRVVVVPVNAEPLGRVAHVRVDARVLRSPRSIAGGPAG